MKLRLRSKFWFVIILFCIGAVLIVGYFITLASVCQSRIRHDDLAGAERCVRNRKWLATRMLNTAYIHEKKEAFQMLLDNGAKTDGIRYGRLSLLHEAARNADSFWIENLLKHGADPNYDLVAHDINPLAEAIEANRPDNVRLLIKYGARLEATTDDSQSMLTRAWSMGRGEIFFILLKNGADYNPIGLRHEGFINHYLRTSKARTALDNRQEIDNEFFALAFQWFKDLDLDLDNATWDKSQGEFGVWSIPPFSPNETQ